MQLSKKCHGSESSCDDLPVDNIFTAGLAEASEFGETVPSVFGDEL